MAEKSFKVKNSLVVKDVEIDPSGATSNQVLKYNGTKFVPAADVTGGATVQDGPPSGTTGQFWYESDTGKTFIFYDSFWVEVASGAGSQGPQGPQGPQGAGSTDASALTSGTLAMGRLNAETRAAARILSRNLFI